MNNTDTGSTRIIARKNNGTDVKPFFFDGRYSTIISQRSFKESLTRNQKSLRALGMRMQIRSRARRIPIITSVITFNICGFATTMADIP